MPSGWLLSPVVGAGTHLDPIRAQVADREHQENDRLEFVVGNQDRCLVAYEVADSTNLTDFSGVPLADLSSMDGDEAALPAARRNQLRRLAQDLGVGDRGTVREVVRRTGKALIGPQFHESVHLGKGTAPEPGSFVVDSFTDTDDTNLASHTGETGAAWTYIEADAAAFVTGNRMRPSDDVNISLRASGTPATAEYDVAADLFVVTNGEFTNGVIGRAAAAGITFYLFDHYGTANQWRLFKVSGGFTSLGSSSQTLSTSTTYAVVEELRDAGKKGYVDTVERISSADNAITSAGFAGVRPYGVATGSTGFHLDNFAASDPGGGGTTVSAASLDRAS